MKQVLSSGQFRKDIKRYSNRPDKLEKLYEIVKLLAEEHQLPKGNKPHRLVGKYKDYMECHVENDLLLIWFDNASNTIKLIRFGTHSELFI